MQQQQQQQRSTGLTLSDEELMVVQQQQNQQQQQIQQQTVVPSYADYATFDAASLGQMSTATVSAVDQTDTSHIDELVAPLSTTAAIMSSVTALEQTASSLMYMDPDTSYATAMKDTRGLLNEQTNVCKVSDLATVTRLRAASKFPRIPTRTKKYQSFISFALSRYQAT